MTWHVVFQPFNLCLQTSLCSSLVAVSWRWFSTTSQQDAAQRCQSAQVRLTETFTPVRAAQPGSALLLWSVFSIKYLWSWKTHLQYSPCVQVRRWSFWRGPASVQAGVWFVPQTAAHHRRVWFPALLSACPTLAPVWRWTVSSAQEKVGTKKFNLKH